MFPVSSAREVLLHSRRLTHHQLHIPRHVEAVGHQVKVLQILRQHTVILLEPQEQLSVRSRLKEGVGYASNHVGTVFSDP